MCLMLSGFAYVILYLLSFSTSNNLMVTVWRNKRIVYVLSTLSQLAVNVFFFFFYVVTKNNYSTKYSQA